MATSFSETTVVNGPLDDYIHNITANQNFLLINAQLSTHVVALKMFSIKTVTP
jgi:hypothetical protein